MTDLSTIEYRLKYEFQRGTLSKEKFDHAVKVFRDNGWKIACAGKLMFQICKKEVDGKLCVHYYYPVKPVEIHRLIEDPEQRVRQAEGE